MSFRVSLVYLVGVIGVIADGRSANGGQRERKMRQKTHYYEPFEDAVSVGESILVSVSKEMNI